MLNFSLIRHLKQIFWNGVGKEGWTFRSPIGEQPPPPSPKHPSWRGLNDICILNSLSYHTSLVKLKFPEFYCQFSFVLLLLQNRVLVLKLWLLNKSPRLKYEKNSQSITVMFYSVLFRSTMFCGSFSNMNNFIYKKIKRFR